MQVHYQSILKTIDKIKEQADLQNRTIDHIELNSHEMGEFIGELRKAGCRPEQMVYTIHGHDKGKYVSSYKYFGVLIKPSFVKEPPRPLNYKYKGDLI